MKPPTKSLATLLAEARNPGNTLADLFTPPLTPSTGNFLANLFTLPSGQSRVNALADIFVPPPAPSPSNFLANLAALTADQSWEPTQSLATLLTGALNPGNALQGERRNEMLYQGTKRRVFISHFRGDRREVDAFIGYFANQQKIFTPYVLGANNNDDFINSTNSDYVMSQIRQNYLLDSTVTIVLIGSCTHGRRYVDWEIKASLRQGNGIIPNGIIGIILPSKGNSAYLPPRFAANWVKGHENCYARYWAYPSSPQQLSGWIDDAYNARTTRAHLISNSNIEMMKYNAKCKVCGITH